MFAKVTKVFQDKYTHEIHPLGSVFECTEQRFAEIQAASPRYVMRVDMPPEERAEDLPGDATETAKEAVNAPEKPLEAMTVRELREYADKAHKLTFSKGMTKAKMIEEIRRYEK